MYMYAFIYIFICLYINITYMNVYIKKMINDKMFTFWESG